MEIIERKDLEELRKYLYHRPNCRTTTICVCGLDTITDKLGIPRVKYCREENTECF
jgi:hypothetical protein